jgi:SAM-dependent methyltransferase
VTTLELARERDTDHWSWHHQQRRYWNGVADRYDRLYGTRWSRLENGFVRRRLAFVRDLDAPLVVDLGCGTGLGGRLIRQLRPNARYLGVDISEEMTRAVAVDGGEVRLGPMDDLGFLDDGAADVVLALFASVSFAYDTGRMFAEVGRVLKPGGQAYLSALAGRSLRRRASLDEVRYRTRGDDQPGSGAPMHMLTVEDVRRFARDAGLAVVSTEGMNVLSGVAEAAPLWWAGRFAARWLPDLAHTIEIRLRKVDR